MASAASAPELAARAAAMDAEDVLAGYRSEFHLPPATLYLDGNSLGLLSRRAESAIGRVVAEWRTLGIAGWTSANPPWISLTDTLAAGVATLVGAHPDEVCITGSTTSNLHQLLATLYSPAHPTRRVILGDELNFASDAHAIRSHLRVRGLDPAQFYREIPSRDGYTLETADILAALTDDVQVAVLPAVLYTSGQLLDMAAIAQAARQRGILIGWDCSHSIGAVQHELSAQRADFAFWCSYKYLNAGPGAVGGLYLHRRHHPVSPGLAGWWGVDPAARFALDHIHQPAAGANALQIGTPHILSLAPLQGSLEIFAEAGIGSIRRKSLALTNWLAELHDRELAPLGLRIVSPRDAASRGGHVALRHPEAWRICQALTAHNVIPDFRRPDVIRLAPAPLYTSFADCLEAVLRLKQVVAERHFEKFSPVAALVT